MSRSTVCLFLLLPLVLSSVSCNRYQEAERQREEALRAAAKAKEVAAEAEKRASAVEQTAIQQTANPIRVAVVTGGHSFDVPNFYKLFRGLGGVDFYPQHLEHFASSPEADRDAYDVVLFYGMDQGEPYESGVRSGGNAREAIERIADQGQGIVVMHHALLAWEKWDYWNKLIGIDVRNFRYKEGIEMPITVATADHEITQGVEDFKIEDEGYVFKGEYDGEGTILLTTDHPDSTKQVAWARSQGDARVLCIALGHDKRAWENESFRKILRQGINWAAEDRSSDKPGE